MRIAAVLCVAMIAMPVASCSNDADGTLSGQVQMYGGPAGANGKQALNGEPGRDWPVTVSSGSNVVATAKSDPSGHFTFHLPPAPTAWSAVFRKRSLSGTARRQT